LHASTSLQRVIRESQLTANHLRFRISQDIDIAIGMMVMARREEMAGRKSFWTKAREGHFGLHGMRERAARIGGKLTLLSSKNSGTEITLLVRGRNIFGKPDASPLEKIKAAFKGLDRP